MQFQAGYRDALDRFIKFGLMTHHKAQYGRGMTALEIAEEVNQCFGTDYYSADHINDAMPWRLQEQARERGGLYQVGIDRRVVAFIADIVSGITKKQTIRSYDTIRKHLASPY